MNFIKKNCDLNSVLKHHECVFVKELGRIKDIETILKIKPNVTPKFHKARPVPYALTEIVTKELYRLESEGVIETVTHSDWFSPIVPVLKGNKLRICGDFRSTVNRVTETEIILFLGFKIFTQQYLVGLYLVNLTSVMLTCKYCSQQNIASIPPLILFKDSINIPYYHMVYHLHLPFSPRIMNNMLKCIDNVCTWMI